ncbi:MAG TPA: hypothetical protein VFP50_13175 [Anaeromyxobacteraceae bacterium]|nr:hypothetical protein [Anaeromyxobacteraceae bacterium]
MQRASEPAQPDRAERLGAKASVAAFIAVQAACWAWGRFGSPAEDVSLWHTANVVLAGAGVGSAVWAVVASRRRWLVVLVVVPLLLLGEAYLLRWEWWMYMWRMRGFAP